MLADREHVRPTSSASCAIRTIASIRSASLGVSPDTGSLVMSLTEKIPNCMKCLPVVPAIERSPSGKPDYRWAADIVAEVPEESDSGGARTASGS